MDEIKKALKIAISALEIASDWNFDELQVNPPEEWGIDKGDGWCSTYELTNKLKEILNSKG